MKNTLWMLALGMLVTNGVHAQIILNSDGYSASVIGTDSLKVTTASSAFPSLTALVDGIWDMSVVADSIPPFFAYRVPTAFPYQFADSNLFRVAGFIYQGNIQSSIADTGIIEYGANTQRISYSISSLTVGLHDSIIIPAQDLLYSSPRTKIAFPATYNSSWASVYHSDLSFQLTYLINLDTLAPGFVRTYIAEKDSVAGWGKMRVLDAGGSPSDYLEVLQVQTMIIRTDSFFLKGVPFSSALLGIFNLTQGRTDTTYEQYYYRPHEVTALAQVEFRDAAYTQPYKAITHTQRLSDVGITNIPGAAKVTIYPNPVRDGSIYIELPTTGGEWGYELADIRGRTIITGQLSMKSNQTRLSLPGELIPGIYYLKINKDGKQVSITPVNIDN